MEQVAPKTWRLTFRPRVLGLNQLSRRWMFHKEKSEWKTAISKFLFGKGTIRLKPPLLLSSTLFEPNQLRDPHNIDGGAMKALLDALVSCGILGDDNWAWIRPPYTTTWVLEKVDPRVELTIVES